MPALQQESFELWREQHDKRMEEIIEHMRTQTVHNQQSGERIAKIETKQDNYERKGATLTAVVSGIVSSIVGGIAGTVFGAR